MVCFSFRVIVLESRWWPIPLKEALLRERWEEEEGRGIQIRGQS